MNQKKLTPLSTLSIVLNINFCLMIIAILWGIIKKEPSMKFQEYGFITKFSALQLISIGFINFLTFKKQKHTIWLLIALGFTFLALDELFLIHENIDEWIHSLLHLRRTSWSDKIDDFIILFYGLIGAFFMLKNYKVFIKNKPALLIAVSGFILMVLSVVVDASTNNTIPFSTSFMDEEIQYHIGVIFEESLKIISEGTLLASFIIYYKD